MPERTVRAEFIEEVVRRGDVFFVKIVCASEELSRRIEDPSRSKYGKLSSLQMFDQLRRDGAFDVRYMPKPDLRLDTGACSAQEAAQQIAGKLADWNEFQPVN